jgi:hypothetical protein
VGSGCVIGSFFQMVSGVLGRSEISRSRYVAGCWHTDGRLAGSARGHGFELVE